MKDQHSPQAVMSSSFQATEACVSPASTPAESSRLKRTDIRPSRISDSASESDWEVHSRRPAVIRIGSSGMPQWTGAAVLGTVGCDLPGKEQDPGTTRENYGVHLSPPRTFWRSYMAESFNRDTESHTDHLQKMPNGQSNQDMPSSPDFKHRQDFPSYQGQFFISPYSCLSPDHRKKNASTAVPNQRKPSNLSDIERQRGPIKKRHIPELLDLSIKRAKDEPARREDPVVALKTTLGSKSCSKKTDPLENNTAVRELFKASLDTLKHENNQSANTDDFSRTSTRGTQPSKSMLTQEVFTSRVTVKQEKCDSDEMEHRGTLESKTGWEAVPPHKIRNREYALVGDTSLDHRTGPTDSSLEFGNHLLGSTSYLNGGFLRLLPEDTFGHWVLQMNHNDPFTAKGFQVEGVPGFKFSHPASKSGHRGHKTALRGSSNDSKPLKTEKPYACEHCSSTFKHRHHVVRHMRAHNGERPFHCEYCGAAFARKCVLTNHRRTHTGEKPYICAECGDSFSRKHHLVIHQRTHSGEKPYRCHDCGAAFARSHHVNRHRKTHDKNHEGGTRSESTSLNNKRPSMVPLSRPDVPITHLDELKLDHDSTNPELAKITPKSPDQSPHDENDIGRASKAESEIECPAQTTSLNI